jgi:Domain of unknown function (DUF6458)
VTDGGEHVAFDPGSVEDAGNGHFGLLFVDRLADRWGSRWTARRPFGWRLTLPPAMDGTRLASARERAAPGYPGVMNRGAGTGLIAFGVVLGLVGAIMAFAVTVHTHGFNINTAGWILLVVGVVVLVIGIAIFMSGSRRSSTTVENVQSTPTGQERVEERRDWGSP